MQTYDANLHFLLHSADLVEAELGKRLAPLDLRPRQALVLEALSRMGAASQVQLAREFGVTPASMSTMTTRLITAGYLSRKTDPTSLRANVLRLTARGDALVAEIRAAWRDTDRQIEALLGAEDAAMLFRLTRRLRDDLHGHVPGTPETEAPDP